MLFRYISIIAYSIVYNKTKAWKKVVLML